MTGSEQPKARRKGFYHSFYTRIAVVTVLVGSVPMLLFAVLLSHNLLERYRTSLQTAFSNGLDYASYSITAMLDTYNELSKYSYSYSSTSQGRLDLNSGNYDVLRRILTGEAFAGQEDAAERTREDMAAFLNSLQNTNNNIKAVHFLYSAPDGQQIIYHHSSFLSNYFLDEPFRQAMDLDRLDTASKKLMIYPGHKMTYAGRMTAREQMVVTVARNYFDLNGVVGKERYIGTLFIDFDIAELAGIFSKLDIPGDTVICVADDTDRCLISTDESLNGSDLREWLDKAPADALLQTAVAQYPLRVLCWFDTGPFETQLQDIRQVIYIVAGVSLLALILGALFFSHSLTRPISILMEHMRKVGAGQLKGDIPVTSNDEIGDLTAHFNQMTHDLDTYTKQVYLSKIKQTEAELNALKSQIYPHFLYNTLEVIHMTAVSNHDAVVGDMIEALSDQIRYVIGTVNDLVPLRREVDILYKYIYLLNCRFSNKVQFSCDYDGLGDTLIPKLMLQPLVENAFIHGIKPMPEPGYIQLTAQLEGNRIILTVTDNGVGMDAPALQKLKDLLGSDQPGEKREYEWASIGLKNVHDRLRYLYGEGYGITLFSTPGVGTIVKAVIPAGLTLDGQADEENQNAQDVDR